MARVRQEYLAAVLIALALAPVAWCAGAGVAALVAEPSPSPGPKPSGYCFFGEIADDRACAAHGGLARIRWENECAPDPACTLLPGGGDYLQAPEP